MKTIGRSRNPEAVEVSWRSVGSKGERYETKVSFEGNPSGAENLGSVLRFERLLEG